MRLDEGATAGWYYHALDIYFPLFILFAGRSDAPGPGRRCALGRSLLAEAASLSWSCTAVSVSSPETRLSSFPGGIVKSYSRLPTAWGLFVCCALDSGRICGDFGHKVDSSAVYKWKQTQDWLVIPDGNSPRAPREHASFGLHSVLCHGYFEPPAQVTRRGQS